jgi:hypothetical protein
VTLVADVGLVPVDGSSVKFTDGVVPFTGLFVTLLFEVTYNVQGVGTCGFSPLTWGNRVRTVSGRVGLTKVPMYLAFSKPGPAVELEVTVVPLWTVWITVLAGAAGINSHSVTPS